MSQNFGLSYSELDTLHNIDSEQAAHNIALAYVTTVAQNSKLTNGEDVIMTDVLSLANQYAQAYQYAYNFIEHENDVINLDCVYTFFP